MSELDEKILTAIKEHNSDQSMTDEENSNALDLIKHSFHGKFKLTFLAVVSIQLIVAAFAIFGGFQLVETSDIGSKINWAVAIIVAVCAFAIARIYFFFRIKSIVGFKRSKTR